MKKDLLKGLTDEQIAKVKACKNQDEILALAKKEGVDLSEEQLAAVSGGGCFSTTKCPECGCTKHHKQTDYVGPGGSIARTFYICDNCGHRWLAN